MSDAVANQAEQTSPMVKGLTSAEAAQLLAVHGLNRVTTERDETLLDELVNSLREPMILLLLAVGGLFFLANPATP